MAHLTPENAQFAIISFEGPDEYSRAGGLAVRVRDLANTLAGAGFRTHLFFIGDPELRGVEEQGNLVLHRWAQWISAFHPDGVYDGEWGKLQDLTQSLPPYMINEIVRPAAGEGKVTVLMGEDWQTAGAMIGMGHLLAQTGLHRSTIPVWTANNLYGFDGIHWPSLTSASTLLTVSRYMKHQMWQEGVDPLVTPNGIAPSAVVNVPAASTRKLRDAFASDLALFKIGRFTPDKRWMMAVEAVAIANRRGTRARLLMRGDKSPHGTEVVASARAAGLTVVDLRDRYRNVSDLSAAIAAHPEAEVLNLVSFLPDAVVPVIYAGVDGVLANSGHEPFGLVGLEVMGAGGLAFVGSTGEDYAETQSNAVVLDTDDPLEILVHLLRLHEMPEEIKLLKRRGKETARAYVWPEVVKDLFAKLEYVALTREVEIQA